MQGTPRKGAARALLPALLAGALGQACATGSAGRALPPTADPESALVQLDRGPLGDRVSRRWVDARGFDPSPRHFPAAAVADPSPPQAVLPDWIDQGAEREPEMFAPESPASRRGLSLGLPTDVGTFDLIGILGAGVEHEEERLEYADADLSVGWWSPGSGFGLRLALGYRVRNGDLEVEALDEETRIDRDADGIYAGFTFSF